MPDDPYADPATGVMHNRLGLSTAEELEAAEREITHAALIFLKESPVQPSYDLGHLCAIHLRIFGDIYDWAGQLRTVAIAKGSWFCLPRYIEPAAAEIFAQLGKEHFLRRLAREEFLDRLTFYLGEVNAVHPFREGNARTIKLACDLLAAQTDRPILRYEESDAGQAAYIEAAKAAFSRNYEPLARLIVEALERGRQAPPTA